VNTADSGKGSVLGYKSGKAQAAAHLGHLSKVSAASTAGNPVRWITAAGALAGRWWDYMRSRNSTKLAEKDSVLIADFLNTTGDPVFDGT
jgi:hypothetical protein